MIKMILISSLFFCFFSCQTSNLVTETDLAHTPARKGGKHYVLQVKGGYDDLYQDEIERASKYLPGVRFAYWLQGEQMLLVDFDESRTNIDSISIAIARHGYDTERHKADDFVYKRLAFQCRYR
ncbi:hypothetical protein [Parabacteroides sp. Marseille-P3160]|uniref:hypothetical protein n=1 Tax=Parabacteroides sp. Marseille-P3160 TaxID=1917887 RepID=UPI0009B98DBD|nr:hypothetical protein [Parabacteroides sp. Marseille-P3160]